MSDELVGHIADVLTTKLKVKGRELTPSQRRKFFENFINNKPIKGEDTNADKITVKESTDDEGKAILNVRINGADPIPQDILYSEKGRTLIYEHLKTAKTDWDLYEKQKKDQKVTYSAALHYNEKLMGKTIAQYTDKIQILNQKLFITKSVGPLKNELMYQKNQIIERVNEAFGEKIISEVIIQ